MRSLVEIGVLNALLAGVPALAALTARRWGWRPALVHALWVLVLLKLLTPPLVHVPVLAPAEEAASVRLGSPDLPPRVIARAAPRRHRARPPSAESFRAAATWPVPPRRGRLSRRRLRRRTSQPPSTPK